VHSHGDHVHDHDHESGSSTVKIDANLFEKNEAYAKRNREFFDQHRLLTLNLISSPGSGKTTLLEALARRLGDTLAVIVGDEQTHRDAERIIRAGSRAFQIETKGACHLDAHAVAHALASLDMEGVRFLVIENVGNLICPASYNLGEHLKTALLSTPEGDDKILKYPSIFSRIGLLLITKIDLLEYLDFNPDKAFNECKSLNRHFDLFKIAAPTDFGMESLINYLEQHWSDLYS